MDTFAGIDVGSLSTDCVIISEEEEILSYSITETGANSTEAAEKSFEMALVHAAVQRDQVKSVVATGYGRISVPFAHKKVTEISCHALGACKLFPDTRTVVDIGGQDSKVIRVGPGGKVLDFSMNDKCAAGTGRFLEVMAAKLRVPLSEMGSLSMGTNREVRISSVCTVFAESEVISLVAQNHPKEEIIRGIHHGIANRVWSMVNALGVKREVTMSGGVAKNQGVVAFLEEKLGHPIHVYREPQIVGGLGAALHAKGM
jgi:predicted CoA-substrate-specific enzyme activase